MAVVFDMKGLDKALDALVDIEQTIGRKILQDAMLDSMRTHVEPEAKRLAPGSIASNIKTKRSKRKAHSVSVETLASDRGYDNFVPKFIEYGTADRKHKSGKELGKITPRPFMRPAMDNNRDAVIKHVEDAVFDAVEKIWSGGGA